MQVDVYAIGGRAFAYYIWYAEAILIPSEPGLAYTYRVGTRRFMIAGASSWLWYYDTNGNGTFETLIGAGQDPADPEIPRWADGRAG